jgi:Sec-independent protein translocase protein TatA
MGAELLLGVAIAFVLLGPKRMHWLLGHMGRTKVELDKASRGIKSRLAAELQPAPPDRIATRLDEEEPHSLRGGSLDLKARPVSN